jgi:hypothetical protein
MDNKNNNEDLKYYKAFIRVVKSINHDSFYNTFGSQNIVEKRLIRANDKAEVKQMLLDEYPQFFQNGKVYEKETKDNAQFFYVVIFELYQHEINQIITDTSWICDYCGQKHDNTYISSPRINYRLFSDKRFCRSEDDYCLNQYKSEYFKDIEMGDDENFIKSDSPNYIYKITEKSSNKSYIGKTKNAPFFRWWNHLKHSGSPFGSYFSKTKLSEWTFEVLEELPYNTIQSEVFRIESEYIHKFDSINNGFNTLISNKKAQLLEIKDENIEENIDLLK